MIIRLPVPPSVNALYANRRGGKGYGRIKTAGYRTWLADADKWLLTQWRGLQPKSITGPCNVTIRIPKVRGDASNRTKAAEDYLVSRCITGDDKHNRKVSIEIDERLSSYCEVEVTPASVSAEPTLAEG